MLVFNNNNNTLKRTNFPVSIQNKKKILFWPIRRSKQRLMLGLMLEGQISRKTLIPFPDSSVRGMETSQTD